MANHYGMRVSVFLFVSYSWAAYEQIDQHKPAILIAWTGGDIELHCGNNPTAQRYWKRGEEILTMANTVWTTNPRIETLNSSIILRIKNVSVDDQGQYTCVVNTKPIQRLTLNLQVKSVTCEAPEKPMNGGYSKGDSSSSHVDLYKVNDQIHYFCHRGFELVGSTIRTCSGPPQGWTPDEPSCEPDYIIRLQKSMALIVNKMTAIESKCSTLESKVTTMQSKITTLENRMATMENITSSIDCTAKCKSTCPDGFTKLGNQCYFFGTDEKTRPEALSICQSMGSTLAYPKNSEENSLLKDHVRKNYKTLDWWIGGTDAAKEGTWVWGHDQSLITYTDWNPGEPNNGGSPGAPQEACLFLGGQWNTEFLWHDAPCSWKEAFICQFKI